MEILDAQKGMNSLKDVLVHLIYRPSRSILGLIDRLVFFMSSWALLIRNFIIKIRLF